MNAHEKINYVEFPAKDIDATKAFLRKSLAGHLKNSGLIMQPFQDKEWTVVFSGPSFTLQACTVGL